MREIQEPAKSPEPAKPSVLSEGERGSSLPTATVQDVAQLLQRTLSDLRSKRDGALFLTSLDGADDAKEKKEAKEAAEKAVKALVSDAKEGKWGKESKEAFKRIFDEVKANGATPDEMYKVLNRVGAGINDILKKDGSKNTIGLAQATENGEVTFRMTLNGPKINKADNLKAILNKKDIDSVYTVGSMKEEKKD